MHDNPFPEPVRSIPNVCDVERVPSGGRGSEAPSLLVEIPHGATRRSDYDRVRSLLTGNLPDDLIDYFFVNTDVGSYEYGSEVARLVADPDAPVLKMIDPGLRREVDALGPQSVLLVRCLIPRTFIDTNRIIEPEDSTGGLTKAIADYVESEADREVLVSMHRAYARVAERAFDRVCGAGGLALTPHTYAPKAIFLRDEDFDEGIVGALRKAYSPERYETWTMRPHVDVISEDAAGVQLAPAGVIGALRERLAARDIEVAENASYRLHPASMGHRFAARHPGQVLCLEVRRDLLGDPFTPFEETRVSPKKARRIAEPIAASLLEELARRSR